jgi:hypothetical protein
LLDVLFYSHPSGGVPLAPSPYVALSLHWVTAATNIAK